MYKKTYLVPIGPKKRGINATLCEIGYAKVEQHAAKLQYRKSEGKVLRLCQRLHVEGADLKRKPYIFARFIAPATGKTKRPELGRWLLDSELPVIHLNGDPLDFRVANLAAQETQRQKERRELAAARRAERDERKAKAAERRTAKKPVTPDGLTPEQQLAVAFDPKFLKALTRVASAIVRDPMQRGTRLSPTDEKRGDEIVSMVIDDSIKAIMGGQVKNVRGYLWVAVLTQARKERARKWYGMGHVRRPRQESKTMSDARPEEREQMLEEADEAA